MGSGASRPTRSTPMTQPDGITPATLRRGPAPPGAPGSPRGRRRGRPGAAPARAAQAGRPTTPRATARPRPGRSGPGRARLLLAASRLSTIATAGRARPTVRRSTARRYQRRPTVVNPPLCRPVRGLTAPPARVAPWRGHGWPAPPCPCQVNLPRQPPGLPPIVARLRPIAFERASCTTSESASNSRHRDASPNQSYGAPARRRCLPLTSR